MGHKFKLYIVWPPRNVGGVPQLRKWAIGRCSIYGVQGTQVVAEICFGFDSQEAAEEAEAELRREFDWIIYSTIIEEKSK